MKNSAILLISCPDRKGEVATIADFIFRHNGNILHADEHGDEESGLFLMRVEFDPKDFDIDLADFGRHFSPIAEAFNMQWRLAQSSHRQRMIIFVSKYDHCLVDLLYRQKSGELACDIPLIISNHPDNQRVAEFYKIPYAMNERDGGRSGAQGCAAGSDPAKKNRSRTMKYICLGYYDKGKHEGMTEGEQHAMFDTCFEYDDHLRANGHWAGGEALQPAETALTLYWKNGKVATTDGPYAETKEQLGGILVLEARDMNHAVQLISQHPALKYGSIFEIRPAADLNEMMKASERRRQNTAR